MCESNCLYFFKYSIKMSSFLYLFEESNFVVLNLYNVFWMLLRDIYITALIDGRVHMGDLLFNSQYLLTLCLYMVFWQRACLRRLEYIIDRVMYVGEQAERLWHNCCKTILGSNATERSMSCSLDFSVCKSTWKQHNLWLARPEL